MTKHGRKRVPREDRPQIDPLEATESALEAIRTLPLHLKPVRGLLAHILEGHFDPEKLIGAASVLRRTGVRLTKIAALLNRAASQERAHRENLPTTPAPPNL